MATFQIHEDVQNVDDNKKSDVSKVTVIEEVSKKRRTRSAFQTVNNIKQDSKRFKVLDQSKDVRIISVQNVQKNDQEESKENDLKTAEILDLKCIQLSNKKDVVPFIFEEKTCEGKELFPWKLLYNEEYRSDIWSYLKQSEQTYQWPIPTYMSKQKHLDNNMRCILIDWLAAVCDEYKMNEETLHLAVNYIDRFLSKMSVVKDKFQLLGSVAMFVASKVEEIYPPDAKEWVYLSSNIYTVQQMKKMEQLLLKVLKFDLQPPTMLSFIRLLCVDHTLDDKTMFLAMYLSELVLLEGEEYLNHLPLKLASASVALARYTLSDAHPWPKKLESSVGYNLKQLSPIVKKQNKTFKNSPLKSQQAIQTRYGSSKYQKVALLKPKRLSDSDFFNEN